jgi:phosphatidylglycerol:prolipoprotein diacylglycerol transferase
MELTFTSQHIYFYLFYFLAFTFLALAVIIKGRKHGYRYSTLLLFLGTITLAIVLGSRLATIPLGIWPDLMFENETTYLNRSAVGGVVLGLVALIIAQKALKLSNRFVIHFVWITPIGLAIQKLGCFINGCCFGNICTNFLGVQYPKNTNVHFNHWDLGYIADSEMFSLPVYPVQLFEVLAFIAVAIVCWQLRKRWRDEWSALWLGLFFLFAARFGLEFLRDPIGSQFSVNTYIGLRAIHWVIFSLAVFSLIMFIFNERRIKLFKWIPNLNKLQLFLVVSLLTILFHGLFLAFEWGVLWITLLPALGIITYEYLVLKKTVQKWGWTSMALIVPMIVIAQTVDTLKVKMEKFNEVNLGFNTGDFYNLLEYDPQTTTTGGGGGGCGGGPYTTTTYTKEQLKQEYSAFGAGYSHVKRNYLKSTRLGFYGYYGNIDFKAINLGKTYSNSYWGFSPYIQYDRRWWGVGAGFQVGKFYTPIDEDQITSEEDQITPDVFEATVEDYNFWPSVYARFGPRKYLDLVYRYGDFFPTPFPMTYHQFSVGTGLLQDYDYGLRYGKFFPGGEFISAEGIIRDRYGVKIMYIMKEEGGYELAEKSGVKWVINFSYRFGGDLKK